MTSINYWSTSYENPLPPVSDLRVVEVARDCVRAEARMSTETTAVAHTPGPWFVRTGPPNGVAVHWCLDGQICPLRWTDGLRPEVEARVLADARLIAAAPDLLAALKLIESVYRLNCVAVGEPSSVLAAVQAAIQKAEGQ